MFVPSQLKCRLILKRYFHKFGQDKSSQVSNKKLIFDEQKPSSDNDRICPQCRHRFTTFRNHKRITGKEDVPVYKCFCGSTRSCVECQWCREAMSIEMTEFQCRCEKGSRCKCGSSEKLTCKCIICSCLCGQKTWQATPQNEGRIASTVAKQKRKQEKEADDKEKYSGIKDGLSKRILTQVDERVITCLPTSARKNLGLEGSPTQIQQENIVIQNRNNTTMVQSLMQPTPIPIFNPVFFGGSNAPIQPPTQVEKRDIVQACGKFVVQLKKNGKISEFDASRLIPKILFDEDKRILKSFETFENDPDEFISLIDNFFSRE